MDTASMDTTTRSGFGPVEIHSARGLDPALREILEVWFKEEFGQTIYQWSPADWYAVVKADGDPVGRLGILARTIAVGGDAVQVGGIAGVATRPEWRHRGVASVLMRAAAQFIQQDLKCRLDCCSAGARSRRSTRTSDGGRSLVRLRSSSLAA